LDIVAAIDVGGTKTRVEVYSEDSDQVEDHQALESVVFPTPRSDGIAAVLAQQITNLTQLAKGTKVKAVGVGAPGPLDPRKGVVLNPPNLPICWHGLPLKDELEKRLEAPVALENDCNLGALGESVFGNGKGRASVLYITVSTGIGAGLVIEGDIFGGARGFAGELGHVKVADGPLCGCGRNGCLEALASGSAIARRAIERGWTVTDGTVTSKAVAEAASQGEAIPKSVLSEAAAHLGDALVSFVYAFDPSVVLLGGGVSQSDLFLELVRESARREPTMPAFEGFEILRAGLGERSVVHGAHELARTMNNIHLDSI
jgi:glucokinase